MTNLFLHFVLVIGLLGFSLLVTTRQYVGNPIDCVHTRDIPEVTSSYNSLIKYVKNVLVVGLLGFSLLVTSRQYVGNPISCVHTRDIPEVTNLCLSLV